ncbi:MAG: hypothetical protein QGH85_02855 [Candidatus Pacebacteria bacterium]|jgi:hypothetical protein|nr:hypothetical protein [Candidatus Paceibacterota bacterium]
MKERKVDECLPPWLNSKILSAVDFVWQVRVDDNMGEQSKRRIKSLSKQLDMKEMCWVLMLLTLPKINDILMDSKEAQEFKAMKQERTYH